MKTIIVDFSKRTEKNTLFLTGEQSKDIRPKESVRLTDREIAVNGVVQSRSGRLFVTIDWHTTDYDFFKKDKHAKK